jgi:L-asparaginase
MVAAVAGQVPDVRISILPGPQRLSHELTGEDWLTVARAVQRALEADVVDAVVVTHGTNNLEEIAYLLALTIGSEKPVVVTGSMLPWNVLGTDGASNLTQAVRLAAADASRGRGVLIAFGREILAPRSATKISTTALSAFAAPGAGPLGRIDPHGTVRYTQGSLGHQAPAFHLTNIAGLPRVDVIASHPGADGSIVDACVAAGAAGLVTAAGGGGVTTTAELRALRTAADGGVIVCQASRIPGGVVQLTQERMDNGFVAAGDLSPWKARILLMLALTRSKDLARIRDIFSAG